MKPAEEKHIINAYKSKQKKGVKGASKLHGDTEIDIREASWQKIKGNWVNSNGLSPADPDSIKKVEDWVKAITRISPGLLDSKEQELEDLEALEALGETNSLDHQLSAVEGHKKIEIIDNRDTKQEAQITENPALKLKEPIGIDLETKPWIDKAKMITAFLAGISIATILVTANNIRISRNQSILSSVSPSNTQKVGFSTPLHLGGLGTIYLYNQEWEIKYPVPEATIKAPVIRLLSAHANLKLEEIKYSKNDISQKVSEIDNKKIPMLVIIPEGKEKTSNNLKIWVSKSELILIEKTLGDKTTWKIVKIKRFKNQIYNNIKLPFLKTPKP